MATIRSGPPPFVQQMHRAAAQRGRLEPLYQDLSEQLTRILQRLYPVWALIGPGLSDPGHIELHSRWIYLDADELLGPRETLMAGTLPRRHILRTFGVALHETFHAKHTKRWVMERDLELARSDDAGQQQLAADRRLLEEPRMEAHGLRDFPPQSVRARFSRLALQAAIVDTMLPRFVDLLIDRSAPVSRDLAGTAAVYLRARTLYGAAAPASLAGLEPVWRAVLGQDDTAALDALLSRVIWIADGDVHGLDAAARAYREIIGPPDEPETAAEGLATVGSLADAVEAVLARERVDQVQQLDHHVDLHALLEDLGQGGSSDGPDGQGLGTGAPSGRLPNRGVDRAPFPDEVAHARRYATRMRQAMTLGTRTVDKRTPGGRFDGRAYARGQAQCSQGRPVTTHPWRVTRVVAAPIEEPHVALVIDTSGSMHGHEYALGPIAWIISAGLRQVGGRCAIALFGSGAELLTDGSERLRLVPGIRTGGGTAFAGDAIVAASDCLDITNPRRPRIAYVLSDGGWYDTAAGVERIQWLAALGVPTVHIAIGTAPLSVEAHRIVVIDDPADTLDQIAADTVDALRSAAGARRRVVRTNGSR